LWRFAHHYNQKSLYTLRFVAENISATESLVQDPGSTPLESPIFKVDFYVKVCTWAFSTIVSLSKFHVGWCDACSQFRGWGD
jgi:hypothetical protein